MKLAKKIFVGIAAVVMLVSCLALSVSAEDPVLPSDNTEAYNKDFIREISNLDMSNKDYTYMVSKYNKLTDLLSEIDVTDTDVAQAVAVYNVLGENIRAIDYNVKEVFEPAVLQMNIVENDTVSAESPYLTKDFMSLIESYNAAKSVYKNGSVHSLLDPKTYPGLSTLIAKYTECEKYIDDRITECTLFISMVEGAKVNPNYAEVQKQINKASAYLDSDKENSLEDYDGVAQAIADYFSIKERLDINQRDAEAYISAVAEIDIDAPYAELRAAVDKAYALKENGAITGIDGVKEANIAFSIAEAKVVSLEKASQNLINTVAELKAAKSFDERRSLIFRANGIKDSAEDGIDGVLEAKAELEAEIAQYNADIAVINQLFAGVMENACSATSSIAPTEEVSDAIAVIIAGLK